LLPGGRLGCRLRLATRFFLQNGRTGERFRAALALGWGQYFLDPRDHRGSRSVLKPRKTALGVSARVVRIALQGTNDVERELLDERVRRRGARTIVGSRLDPPGHVGRRLRARRLASDSRRPNRLRRQRRLGRVARSVLLSDAHSRWFEAEPSGRQAVNARSLLQRVGELMGQQPAAIDPIGVKRAGPEEDVVADGECPCPESLRGAVRPRVLMDPNLGEVTAEPRLHLAPHLFGQRSAR
jgi:hypothetical protein